MNRIHVGVDATGWFNNRGFGRFTRELVTALAQRDAGFRYTLLMDRPPDESIPATVEVRSTSTGSTLDQAAVGATSRSPRYLWNMSRVARAEDFDLLFYPSVYAYFPILTRAPCVVCYHDTTGERYPKLLFPTLRNRLLWNAKTALARWQTTRAMTVSQASADDVERILRIPGERIDVITEAASQAFRLIEDPTVAQAARARQGIPEGAPLFTYVGGMNPHKNLPGLVDAMRRVVAARPDVHLAIVGDTSGKGFWDDVPGLKRYIAEHPPLADHVHFTGYLSDEALAELLNGTQALVFPSLWEGFGLPAVEAMSCGVPVLASGRSALPEVVGDAGRYFDPESIDSIADCLLQFLEDPALGEQLGRTALARARLYTWDRAAELAEACFRRCHAAHPVGARSQTSGAR